MNIESILQRLSSQVSPKKTHKDRIRERIAHSIGEPLSISDFSLLHSNDEIKARVWDRVLSRIEAPAGDVLLQKIKDFLTPTADVRSYVAGRMLSKIQLQPAPVGSGSFGFMKWISATVVIAIIVGLSPSIFLVSPTLAGSDVRLMPTQGRVAVSIGGLWQEVGSELVLEPGMRIRTFGSGEASIIFHDDGVLRLGANTIIALHDTSEHLEAAPEPVPSASLIEGSLWIQGLIPANSRGFSIATPHGYVTVNEGSMSLAFNEDDDINVAVWDRRATVIHNGIQTVLVAGESTQLRPSDILFVKKVDEEQFHEKWQKQNLARDAVHRRYIAHLQKERLASKAGILPTSSFYSMKRVAEEVDVLLSFSEESRVQKRLDQAHTRLNEAAALIASGKEDAVSDSLDEFKGTLLRLTSGSGGNMVAHFLIKQSVSEAQADLAAALPGDESYVLKRVVIQAAADLPADIVDLNSVNQVLFADALDQLLTAADSDNLDLVREKWLAFQPHLTLLEAENTVLDPELIKEANSSLERIAMMIDDNKELVTEVDPDLHDDLLAFLPQEDEKVVLQLSDEQVQEVVTSMVDRIYVYKMPNSRSNQLRIEVSAIYGHEEEGRFLRELYRQLPSGSRLTEVVRKEIVRLRWDKAADNTIVQDEVDSSEPTNI